MLRWYGFALLIFLAYRLKPIIFFLLDVRYGGRETFGGEINWTILWAIGAIVPTLPLCYNVTIIYLTILQNSKILLLNFITTLFIFLNFLNLLFYDFNLSSILQGRLISFPHKLFIFLENMPQHNKIAMYALYLLLRAAERLLWRSAENGLTFECHPYRALYFINHLYYMNVSQSRRREESAIKKLQNSKEIDTLYHEF